MAVILGFVFLGISFLATTRGSGAIGQTESVLSQVGRATFGQGPAWYILLISTMGILVLAAQTSFADFPRLASILARDGFMPRGLRLSRRTPRLQRRDRRPGGPGHPRRGRLRRPGRGPDPAVRDRGVHGLHPVAGGHGPSLVRRAGPGLATQCPHQRRGGRGHGDRCRRLRRREVRPRRLDHPHRRAAHRGRDAAHPPRVRCGGPRSSRSPPDLVWGPPAHRRRVVIPVSGVQRDVIQAVRFARSITGDITAVHVTDDVAAGERLRERVERQLPGVEFVHRRVALPRPGRRRSFGTSR